MLVVGLGWDVVSRGQHQQCRLANRTRPYSTIEGTNMFVLVSTNCYCCVLARMMCLQSVLAIVCSAPGVSFAVVKALRVEYDSSRTDSRWRLEDRGDSWLLWGTKRSC